MDFSKALTHGVAVRPNNKGYGLYADHYLPEGRLLLCSPVLLLTEGEVRGALWDYVWHWTRGRYGLTLDQANLFNHADDPNVEAEQLFKKKLIKFTSKRPIHIGEELTIDYGKAPDFKVLPPKKLRM